MTVWVRKVGNRGSIVRPPTALEEMIADNCGFNPMSNELPEELYEDFTQPIDLSYEVFAPYV